jgi:TPP-dependent indolepyruvate ferredoxin oxidoreductase alpha subunit
VRFIRFCPHSPHVTGYLVANRKVHLALPECSNHTKSRLAQKKRTTDMGCYFLSRIEYSFPAKGTDDLNNGQNLSWINRAQHTSKDKAKRVQCQVPSPALDCS